jgi:hypothetical protein
MQNIEIIQIQQYYEKQVMLRCHIQEREDKRRELRR